MDRISQLPESIVHHILSFININNNNTPAALVRMRVLSKTWFHLTASFPFLDFDIYNFRRVSVESFYKYVEYTTSRFCQQNVTAYRLKLVTTIREPAELDIVNRCLELVLKNGVSELVIDLSNSTDPSYVSKYCLRNILLSVSVLKSLEIRDCNLPSSLMLDAVKFKSLVQFKLICVQIDDEVIKYLATSCPLLQELHIDCCSGFKRVCVYGHQNLQKFIIHYDTPLERIDIEAPNLSSLEIIDEDQVGAPRMNLASCKKVTSVTYMGEPLPDSNGFTDFLSNFPFIENLFLSTTYGCNNLKISSHSLRTLMLHSVGDFEEIEFSTPNLVLFAFRCFQKKFWPVVRHSNRFKACMQCFYNGFIETPCFQKLRRFLDKKNGFKVLNLYIHAVHSQGITDLEDLKAIELPPYELEHVELQLDTREDTSAHVAFVNAVLWCCRPRSLTLRSSDPFEEQSDVVKFAYKKLLEQEDQGHTKVQIASSSSPEAQKHLMDLEALSMALPREGKTISFIKEEVLQEDADRQRHADKT